MSAATVAIAVAPAVAGAVASHELNKNNSSGTTTPAQSASLSATSQTAGQQSQLAGYLQKQGMMTAPALGQAQSYYSTLLNGNRAAMQQAVSPEANAIADTTKGAQMNLERMGVTGGQKIQAMADLNRQAAGQQGQLTVGVRPAAAQQLTQIGQIGLGAQTGALSGLSGAASTYSNLLGQSTNIANTQYQRNQQMGQMVGGLVSTGLQTYANRNPGGGGVPSGSTGDWTTGIYS